jgi:hypothetical protein
VASYNTASDGQQSSNSFQVNRLLLQNSTNSVVVFLYLPLPLPNQNDEEYLSSLSTMSDSLPPVLFVHGISPVTSTNLWIYLPKIPCTRSFAIFYFFGRNVLQSFCVIVTLFTITFPNSRLFSWSPFKIVRKTRVVFIDKLFKNEIVDPPYVLYVNIVFITRV